MITTGLISATHNYLDDAHIETWDKCDEIWHADDLGMNEIALHFCACRFGY